MKKNLLLLILTIIFLSSCAQSSSDFPKSSAPTEPESADKAAASGGGGGGQKETDTTTPFSIERTANAQTETAPVERKIIRDADLQLESAAPEETQAKIASIAESKGGFIISSTQSSSTAQVTTRDTVNMTARVPAAKFDEALNEIRQAASRVVVETISGKDVTEEFVDIEARLKTKRALEEQFLEIMKRSNSVADALSVQRELANVRGEIEQIEGRKRFLENQTSLSTIKLTIKTPTAFSGNSVGFFYRLKEAVGTGFNAASGVLFFLITAAIALIPFFLIIVLPLYLLLRYWLRNVRRKRTATEIARDEIGTK